MIYTCLDLRNVSSKQKRGEPVDCHVEPVSPAHHPGQVRRPPDEPALEASQRDVLEKSALRLRKKQTV